MADYTGLEPDPDGLLVEAADQAKFAKFCSELDPVMDSFYVVLVAVVKQAMRAAGEDADNAMLVALRVRQASYSIDSKSQREWNRASHNPF
jgi:hypothetical protein